MKKADFVYAAFYRRRDSTQFLFELEEEGLWTLIGGSVRPNESEHDALRRHIAAQWHCRSQVVIEEQVGPIHLLPDNKTGKAFSCYAAVWEGELGIGFVQACAFTEMDVRSAVPLAGVPIERIIWDVFSIFRAPISVSPIHTASGMTGIYCDPGQEHLLVEEGQGERWVWPRLDPSSSAT